MYVTYFRPLAIKLRLSSKKMAHGYFFNMSTTITLFTLEKMGKPIQKEVILKSPC